MHFRGTSEHTIDAKGRTSVPARFRESIGEEEKLIVTMAFERCLHIHPLKNWEAIEEKLGQRSTQEPGVKQIYRVYVANATEMEVDKLGRVLLPSKLREYAQLEKEVVWVGVDKRMEIWSKANWDKAQAEAFSDEHRIAVQRVMEETKV
jgi:MraZ protein